MSAVQTVIVSLTGSPSRSGPICAGTHPVHRRRRRRPPASAEAHVLSVDISYAVRPVALTVSSKRGAAVAFVAYARVRLAPVRGRRGKKSPLGALAVLLT
jgi:hypothetical protein